MAEDSVDSIIRGHKIQRSASESNNRGQFLLHLEECPLCGQSSTTAVRLFTVLQLRWDVAVIRCRRCRLAYKEYIPNGLILNRLYGENYEHFRDPLDIQREILKCRSRVKRMGRPRGRHLDYGCGAGYLVACALQAGWDSFGVDPYLPIFPIVSSLAGRLSRGTIIDSAVSEKLGLFDCISLWAVFEHITSLRKTLSVLVKMLNPGGQLIFNSPDAHSLIARRSGTKWHMAVLLEHLQFCSRTCARWIAGQYNLTIRSLRIAGLPYPLSTGPTLHGDQKLECSTKESTNINQAQEDDPNSMSKVSNRFLRIRILESASHALLADGGIGLSAMIIRQAIHGLRLGDHIEIVFDRH